MVSFAVLISGIACQSLNTAFSALHGYGCAGSSWDGIRSDPHHERGVGNHSPQATSFNEFTLMLLASLGAFYIGEYPEAVAVMLFLCRGRDVSGSCSGQSPEPYQVVVGRAAQTATVRRDGQ